MVDVIRQQPTTSPAYAAELQLQKAGVKVHYYDKVKPAKLCDGSLKDSIIGCCLADVELVTRAGIVILPRTHIDILQGPEQANLLYLGKVEEKRLRIKTYAEQLEEVAVKARAEGREARFDPLFEEGNSTEDSLRSGDNHAKCQKKKTALPESPLASGTKNQVEVHADGELYVGEHNWQTLLKARYVLEPLANACYVTTAALTGVEGNGKSEVPEGGVSVLDLDEDVKKWLGGDVIGLKYIGEVEVDLRLLTDKNRDTVKRLTKITGTRCRVIESDRRAEVLGKKMCGHLAERMNEDLGSVCQGEVDIEHRLDEMLDAARAQEMSSAGLEEARQLIKEKWRNIWRLKLRPGDVANLPAMKIELEEGEKFELPRPYRRRYTPAEMRWWETRIAELCRVGVMRFSGSGQLSPSNLLPKKLDGVVLMDDFRLIVDLRNVNKKVKTEHYGIPKLDTIIHHLTGSGFFAKGDNVNGYWQLDLAEESRKYTAFDCPVGAVEHCRVPQGYKNAGPWFQKCFEGVLGELLWKAILQYLDDSLLHAKTEKELLRILDLYFAILDKHNIKLHPAKFTLFARKLTWCGKEISAEGVRRAPQKIATVLAMAEPKTLSEMMRFVYGIAWFRGHILRWAEISAPLYDIWKEALTPYKRKTMNNAKKFVLSEIPAWKNGGRAAFAEVKRALAESITTAFFDPEKKLVYLVTQMISCGVWS